MSDKELSASVPKQSEVISFVRNTYWYDLEIYYAWLKISPRTDPQYV